MQSCLDSNLVCLRCVTVYVWGSFFAVYHRCDVRLRMWVSGARRRKNFHVVPLSEEMAIDIGSDLIGETFIFAVAAGKFHRQYIYIVVGPVQHFPTVSLVDCYVGRIKTVM